MHSAIGTGRESFLRRKNSLFWDIAEPSIWTHQEGYRWRLPKKLLGKFSTRRPPKQNAACCSDNIQIFPGMCFRNPWKFSLKMKFQQALRHFFTSFLLQVPVIVCSKSSSSHWNKEHREKNPGCVGGAKDSKYLEEAKSKDLRNRKGAQVFQLKMKKDVHR